VPTDKPRARRVAVAAARRGRRASREGPREDEMRRPRWHDALIALAIVAIAASGVWALWGTEIERALGRGAPPPPPPPSNGFH
jgi:hypothetical protein